MVGNKFRQLSSTKNLLIRCIRKISTFFGIWPLTEDMEIKKRTWRSIVIFFLLALRLLSHTTFLFTHSSAAISIKGMTFLWIMNAATDQIRIYKQVFENEKQAKSLRSFFETNHLSQLEVQDDYSMKISSNTEKNARLAYVAYMALMTTAFIIPMIDDMSANYLAGGFSTSMNVTIVNTMNMAVPLNVETNPIEWFCTFFFYFFSMFFQMLILVPQQDFILFYIVYHELIHWRILKSRMLNISLIINNNNEDEAYVGSLEKEIYENLKECIRYHNFILKFHKEIQNIYGFLFKTIYFLVVIYACCTALMLTDSRAGNLNKYATLLAATYIYLFSWTMFFSQLKHASGEVGEVAYSLPWSCMSKRCRQALAMMVMRAQTPVGFRVYGSIETSLETMVQIVKGSYSMYATLNNFN
uniref:Odorant receptor n=1 Tax=Eriocrania semipurpurella TaxID=41180 RepID=A0A2H4NTA3_9NEOP|nr:odorant receptor 1 [Eriocrania semipurpurella]